MDEPGAGGVSGCCWADREVKLCVVVGVEADGTDVEKAGRVGAVNNTNTKKQSHTDTKNRDAPVCLSVKTFFRPPQTQTFSFSFHFKWKLTICDTDLKALVGIW